MANETDSARWTWRGASREANVRNGLDAYARRRGTYLSPNASANAFRRFVFKFKHCGTKSRGFSGISPHF